MHHFRVVLFILLVATIAAASSFRRRPDAAGQNWIVHHEEHSLSHHGRERRTVLEPVRRRAITNLSDRSLLGFDPERPYDWVPQSAGRVAWTSDPTNNTLTFMDACAGKVAVTLGPLPGSTYADQAVDGARLTIVEGKKTGGLLCTSPLLMFDRWRFVTHDWVFGESVHHIDLTSWNAGEREDVLAHGFHVMFMPNGTLGTVADLWETLQLFKGHRMTADNVQWLEHQWNYTFKARTPSTPTPVVPSALRSGDMLAVRRWVDGLDAMIMLGTGGHTGHTAMILEFPGEGWFVVESTVNMGRFWPKPTGVIRTEYATWINQVQDAGEDVAVLRLSDEVSARFNATAAVNRYWTLQGNAYGYSTFIFGWQDTPCDTPAACNWPPPTNRDAFLGVMLLADAVDPSVGDRMWCDALNHRLATRDLGIEGILDECDARHISIFDLIAVPEQDDWLYPNAEPTFPTRMVPSRVCSSFVIDLYKYAGVFPDGLIVQATELTPRDAYSLRIFDEGPKQSWCPHDGNPSAAYCQVTGAYILDLPDFNTVPPHDNMFERCGGMPPRYERPDTC